MPAVEHSLQRRWTEVETHMAEAADCAGRGTPGAETDLDRWYEEVIPGRS